MKIKKIFSLFLTSFTRICKQMDFAEETWSLHLLSLLSGNAREVVSRLLDDDFQDFEKVKSALLNRSLQAKFR